MAKNLYPYAVARIRSKELSLLNSSMMDQLIGAKTEEDCLNLLAGKGWDTESGVDKMFASEQKKTWDLLSELVSDLSVFNVFLLKNDYHNLKAAIKLRCTNTSMPSVYILNGTVPVEKIQAAVEKSQWDLLPEEMQAPAQEAFEALLHTRDGQLCDFILDKACLCAIEKAGKASDTEAIREYAERTVAAADIKIAVRALHTGKPLSLIESSLAPCDSLDTDRLAKAATQSEEAIFDVLSTSRYADAIDSLRESPSAFESWCDNLIIRKIRKELYNPFTLGPLAAFLIAKETELKSVRILLSGKRNGMPEDFIRQRMRELYVV
jgi:V/A-type H+-transporting ATPase subunit C